MPRWRSVLVQLEYHPVMDTYQGLPLSDLPSILPTVIVCDAYSSLKQSFEFHRNRVFGEYVVKSLVIS